MKKTTIIFLLLSCFLISCNKKEDLVQQVVKHPKPCYVSGDPYEYRYNHLYNIALSVVNEAYNNSSFKQSIYSEIADKIDNDYNALIEIVSENNSNLSNSEFFNSEMSAFDDIDGNKYFPQIFIPSYDTLELQNLLNSSNDITFVIFNGYDTINQVIGYKFTENGIDSMTLVIDEEYCETHEVWVFSLNETFVNNYYYMPSEKTTNSINPYISYILVRTPKECWLAGKSDVYMKTYTCWDNSTSTNPYDYTTNQVMWLNSWGDLYLKKVNRKDIKNSSWVTVLRVYAPSWEPGNNNPNGWQGNVVLYTIYEHDCWPTGERSQAVMNGQGFTINTTFRSADGVYDAGYITWDNVVDHWVGAYTRNIPGSIAFITGS